MDHDRFDDLTRALATTRSRRQFLKTLAGGATGGLLALLGVGAAAADDTCKPVGKKCNKDGQCCSGLCTDRVCKERERGNLGLFQDCEYDYQCASGICDAYAPGRGGQCLHPCTTPGGTQEAAGCGIQDGASVGFRCCDFGDGQYACAEQCPAT